ncbi:MAG TPA: ABC transporter permease, partial [Thermoanaerobaculia bacterium]|nr:ABC transporter permease [Thermoanaerobaculia bacterium]
MATWRRTFRLHLRKGTVEQDVNDELAFHLEEAARELMAGGMEPQDARDEALRRFGEVEKTRQTCREIGRRRERGRWWTEGLGALAQDLRFSLRTLRKSPAFTAVAVFTLMLGIGANSAIFSIVNAVLLRPLPYPAPERLMTIWNWTPDLGQMPVSQPELLDYAGGLRSFQAVAGVGVSDVNLSGSFESERVGLARISASLFPILGVRPVAGRTFLPEEDRAGRNREVVLGYDLWRRRFGGRLDVVGQSIRLDDVSHLVVGVAPRGFHFPGQADLWAPLGLDPATLNIRGQRDLQVVGRLKPGVTLEQARAEAGVLIHSLAAVHPEYAGGRWAIQVVPLREQQVARVRRSLLLLQGAVLLVLLMACANVASLLLARAQARRGEMALRLALGAGPGRVVRQFLFDGLSLGLAGGGLGLLLARDGVRLLLAADPEPLPSSGEIGLDVAVLLWTLAISLLSGLLVSLAAALPAVRTRLTEALADSELRASAGFGARRFRNVLMVIQITLAVVLLIGAGLLLKNFRHLERIAPGFDPNGLLTVRLTLPESRYGEGSAAAGIFYSTLQERLGAIPGVRSAGMAGHLP